MLEKEILRALATKKLVLPVLAEHIHRATSPWSGKDHFRKDAQEPCRHGGTAGKDDNMIRKKN